MGVARHVRAAATHEHIEIGAEVRLLHVIDVQLVPAASRHRRRLPVGAALSELGVAHVEMQAPRGHVDLDEIAVPHQRQRPAGGGLG